MKSFHVQTFAGCVTGLLLFLSVSLPAQDALQFSPGTTAPDRSSRAAARHEYFYQQVTYPEGSIPVGARARAWNEVQQTFRRFSGKPPN